MDLPKRKRIRLMGYDYSQSGAYFITICTQNRECLLGDILVGQGLCSCPTVGDIICAVKSTSTKMANKNEGITGRKIWQFRYHDHIIRDKQEYQKIWDYIDTNPLKWEEDCFYGQK